MKDLFENPNEQPKKLKEICDKYSEIQTYKELDYIDCQNFLQEVKAIGYTFDYGLDAEPINLRKP